MKIYLFCMVYLTEQNGSENVDRHTKRSIKIIKNAHNNYRYKDFIVV
jgi:hypothetical protein